MATEKRLIYLDEAMKATHHEIYWTESQQAAVRSFLVKQTKVDAVEVVRCKDCKHRYTMSSGKSFCKVNFPFGKSDDDFCSQGERKEKAKDLQDCTYNKNGHCIGQKLMPECDAKNCDRRK